MELNNPVEPISEALPLSDQNITSEAPKLLLCSSIASASDPGSNAVTKPQAGIEIGRAHV